MRRARRFRAALAGLLAACALLGPLAGCSEPTAPVAPFKRLGRKAARHTVPPPGSDARMAAARRWGLAAPLGPAPRPTEGRGGPGVPFVVDRVPVRAKVVFLTYDDGPLTDPAFPRMVRDLRLPVALFLAGDEARADAGSGTGAHADQGAAAASASDAGTTAAALAARARVDALRALGAGIYSHTLGHPDLRTLGYARQRAEICGQQDRLAARYGTRPRLFRPPYGSYDARTVRAAKECGVRALVLARVTMTADGLRYAEGARMLRPGDIVRTRLPGPGASTARMTAQVLEHIRARGFTVGRLEDYL
ncbi:polysaccharide deacetylase family protein [Streptomyces sp. NBC_00083]|uniref:polysaccharide deacetylase family protein n=1 Tax=Streptomyces sp. NBC_00083 TaxID=2975647 RepID=UPI00224D7824|nr:polysaccharide deacetylase family protein [Streptomyces sp. NBC_00083]MCX5385097.1 polysaccharide deacetylase family protein [Streptomyces sp. NBC_00083]